MVDQRSLLLLWVLSCLIFPGCGGGAIPEGSAASAQHAFDLGNDQFMQQKYAEAEAAFTKSLETPGLNPDLLIEALLTRARARVELGSLDAAMEDVVAAEQGATEPEQVCVVKGLILRKKGRESEAKAEFARARKLNPRVVIPN